MQNKKTTPIAAQKPFMRGNPTDSRTLRSAFSVLLYGIGALVLVVLVCTMFNFDLFVLRFTTNIAVLLATYLLFFQSGAARGTADVNQGEILLQKQEKGLEISAEEKAGCFHPLKGFVSGLIGMLPVFLCALVLALITKRQMFSPGVLPAWLKNMQHRNEIGDAVAYYNMTGGIGLEGILRLVIRLDLMPLVNILGSEDPDALLLLERFSPVLVLMPAVVHGLGYMTGVTVRRQVHTDIAAGKIKRAKKEKRRRRNNLQRKGPTQLN